jgi:hypothetical protein
MLQSIPQYAIGCRMTEESDEKDMSILPPRGGSAPASPIMGSSPKHQVHRVLYFIEMKRLIEVPHRLAPGVCYANGIEDILAWKGCAYTEGLVRIVGGAASFGYLRFDRAVPPRQVYWGTNPKYFFINLERIVGFKQVVSEGKGAKTTLARVKNCVVAGAPVVAGALDMFYLPFYPEIHNRIHIPTHYLLVVGYDDAEQEFLVYDCAQPDLKSIPYEAFLKALNVKVPGMSARNTVRFFEMPRGLPDELEFAKKGLKAKAEQMLAPPVSMLGIPAMRRLARDLLEWRDRTWFEHMVMYATVPPVIPTTFERSDGTRFMQAGVLVKMATKYGIPEWNEAASRFEQSGYFVIELCKAAMQRRPRTCSGLMTKIADLEEQGYGIIKLSCEPLRQAP